MNVSKEKSVKQKKRGRGRPATGVDPILAMRMPPAITKRVEALAKDEPDKPNRSEMLRRLVEWALEMKERRK
jgi:hypothetical protein